MSIQKAVNTAYTPSSQTRMHARTHACVRAHTTHTQISNITNVIQVMIKTTDSSSSTGSISSISSNSDLITVLTKHHSFHNYNLWDECHLYFFAHSEIMLLQKAVNTAYTLLSHTHAHTHARTHTHAHTRTCTHKQYYQ